MSWWARATTEQRLAQIDGGISLGMTARQIALNCGTQRDNLYAFGRRRGRTFPATAGDSAASGCFTGDETRAVKRRRRDRVSSEVYARDAFSIFSSHEAEEPFMDEVAA